MLQEAPTAARTPASLRLTGYLESRTAKAARRDLGDSAKAPPPLVSRPGRGTGSPQGARDLCSGADDGIRTRDPNLGKVVLYQLSHVRVSQGR